RYSTWVEVDLGIIEANARRLTELTQAAVMAVVKANGYGHGAVPVAQAAARGGASWLGVARAEEALELRAAGIGLPILVLGPVPVEQLAGLIAAGVSLTVSDEAQVDAAAKATRDQQASAKVQLKLDSGMNRLGAPPEAAAGLARRIREHPGLSFEGVFTHFARADEGVPEPVQRQVERFEQALAGLSSEGFRPPLVHAANSAATLGWPATHSDLVRVGIALYGLRPAPAVPLPTGLLPALQWKSQLTRIRSVPPGEGISYGHDYVTRQTERIGTVPVGYADGLRRTTGNQLLVGGVPVPVVGRVCMDYCMVQLDRVPRASEGDEVVIIGTQGASRLSAEQLADRWGTINYEVTCGIGARVPRVYGP
ncbi:MAG: alanine racemase, partial [Anaerolineales bacterium]